MLLTALARCDFCKLLYRIPTDPPAFGQRFYQDAYSQGFTTDCPSPETLKELVARAFAGTPKDFTEKVEILDSLGVPKGCMILDFGASWGYGSWQLQEAGYHVVGFEVSKARARYAREMLRQEVVDDPELLKGPFDVFFSSHVLEHLPSPRDAFGLASRLVRPNGLLVAFTPNGSLQRLREKATHHQVWGMAHPLCLAAAEK